MTKPNFRQKVFEATSQLIAVLVTKGKADSDEMLSSWAYRTQSRMQPWLNWLFQDPNHCQDSYEWEKANYKVDRFK